jgi:hypothetical protein
LTQGDNITSLNNDQFAIVQYDKSCNCIREFEANPPAAGGVSNKIHQAELIQVVLAPPYPPLFEYANGEIEYFSVKGNELHLVGWTEHINQDVEQQFLLVTPNRAEQTRLTRVKLETENKLTRRYQFDLFLSYRDEATAAIARSRLCLLTRSMLTPVGLIRNANPDECSGFVSYQR